MVADQPYYRRDRRHPEKFGCFEPAVTGNVLQIIVGQNRIVEAETPH